MNVEIEEMIHEATEEAQANHEESFSFSAESAFNIMYGQDNDVPDDLRDAWMNAYQKETERLEFIDLQRMEMSMGC